MFYRCDAEVDLANSLQTVVNQLLGITAGRVHLTCDVDRRSPLVIVQIQRLATARLQISQRLAQGQRDCEMIRESVTDRIAVITDVVWQPFCASLLPPVMPARIS